MFTELQMRKYVILCIPGGMLPSFLEIFDYWSELKSILSILQFKTLYIGVIIIMGFWDCDPIQDARHVLHVITE